VTDRRHLLKLATAAATTLWLPRSAWGQLRAGSDPFALGVASGSPRHDSVVLWTRLMVPAGTAAATVQWEVAHDESFARIAQRGQAQALAELGHAVHVEVPTLEPDRCVLLPLHGGRRRQPHGPHPHHARAGRRRQRLRLAYASCQRWEHGYYSAWRHMRADQPDYVVFLGDYIYEYPGAQGAVRFPDGGWALTLDDYRRRYALHRSDAELRAMHAACPWFVTWDDHEVQNDYAGLPPATAWPAGGGLCRPPGGGLPGVLRAHAAALRRADARALQGLATGAELRIHGHTQLGRLASLYLLDARQYKDHQVCTRDGKPGSSYVDPGHVPRMGRPKRSMLGAAQEAWLDGALAQGSAGWNLIGQQSVFGARDGPAGTGPLFMERRLGRLWRSAHAPDRQPAPPRGGQPGVPGRRRARELGRSCEGRLRGAGQPRCWGGVLRHQHYFACRG
jgi:alkaline phosphatase D